MFKIRDNGYMSKEIKEYDENKNLIYFKYLNGVKQWIEYDEYNNCIHSKYSNGYEYWYRYDENNNIHYKSNNGYESWYKYDKDNEQIEITKQEFKQIERRKLYLNNKKCSRFEIMDI